MVVPNINTDNYYTTRQFADRLGDGTTWRTVNKYCQRGTIKAVKAAVWWIPKPELQRFKKERRHRGRPRAMSA